MSWYSSYKHAAVLPPIGSLVQFPMGNAIIHGHVIKHTPQGRLHVQTKNNKIYTIDPQVLDFQQLSQNDIREKDQIVFQGLPAQVSFINRQSKNAIIIFFQNGIRRQKTLSISLIQKCPPKILDKGTIVKVLGEGYREILSIIDSRTDNRGNVFYDLSASMGSTLSRLMPNVNGAFVVPAEKV